MESRSPAQFLPDYLLFLLATASASASAEFHAIAAGAGLRVPEWRVLACLWDEDGQMATHLARLSLIEQSRLTRVIEKMVDRGLVTRQGDEADRRRVRVWLTDEGRGVAAGMVAQARTHEAKLLDVLGEEDGRKLKSLLKRIAETGEIFDVPDMNAPDNYQDYEADTRHK